MPISRYDRFYGGKKGSASEARQAMIARYGQKKGQSVFYALANKRKNVKVKRRTIRVRKRSHREHR